MGSVTFTEVRLRTVTFTAVRGRFGAIWQTAAAAATSARSGSLAVGQPVGHFGHFGRVGVQSLGGRRRVQADGDDGDGQGHGRVMNGLWRAA